MSLRISILHKTDNEERPFFKGHDLFFKGPDSYYTKERNKKGLTNFELSKEIAVLQISSIANLKRM